MNTEKNIVLLLMAGKGTRCDKNLPKQFFIVNGKPVFMYIVDVLNSMDSIDDIIIITNPDYLDYTKECCDTKIYRKVYSIITGGNGRSNDIAKGILEAKEIANDNDVIMMYDATHPLVDERGIDDVISAIKEYGAATLAEYQYDTLYSIDPETQQVVEVVPREKIIAGASPEGFLYKTAYDIFTQSSPEVLNTMTSAGALAKAFKLKMKAVPMQEAMNLKITYKLDMEIFKKIAKSYYE
ncbi:MAG: 2-C-methyl-D-erythritol 4-phosphate cytidylyltransferase [Bacilli bacterium]|nr:2-C-methyl-D-erythritol 4-phosphate cytidylyltransferase [Bacilli bacterium]